ncbi:MULTISPECIES: response regulator transcription factor [Enterococcus]|uniref:Response regulator transcription factor n=1 Tax=Candidatus Enterococcus murrayae TaxID=2815321 RepID=A0ABS3HIA7_9ENTE|nr:response regulator transcription factor [Enterococcus sp. MJM16]MBO0453196.1 response regulator transcription factor [Enterococcus sp. MJM16]
MKKILLVDDSVEFCNFMQEFLETHGFEVITAQDPLTGITLFRKSMVDLVITDLKMGEIDGIQFMTLIQESYPEAKVIILTSSESEEDEFRGLDLKADEYLKKGTSLKIILKRIVRVLEQENKDSEEVLFSKRENLTIKKRTRQVYKNNELVALTRKEYDLLVLFLRNKNRVLSREVIFRSVWNKESELVDSRVIATHVKQIRAKLSLISLYNIRGVGYEWTE